MTLEVQVFTGDKPMELNYAALIQSGWDPSMWLPVVKHLTGYYAYKVRLPNGTEISIREVDVKDSRHS